MAKREWRKGFLQEKISAWLPAQCWTSRNMLALPNGTSMKMQATCECNGRSQYCTVDSQGLLCLNCQGNTEGRHCERCKVGFYHQRAGEICLPCSCNPTGSVDDSCDIYGRCSCKSGFLGDKCDRCPNGKPLTEDGCSQSGNTVSSSNNGDQSECFCYGHTTDCSLAKGYAIHNITSTFSNGDEGWTAAEANGVSPPQLHFQWSSSHGDLEIISKESVPVYMYAPAAFLGNQALSYGAGIKVSASLGNLRTVLPAGQRTTYTFRLDEKAGSKWHPQLGSVEFQKLLQNLTAIKIRGTFGENGRGYLDNVNLGSARLGPGALQYGESPARGPFSPCKRTCDIKTGDCYSGDENNAANSCSTGYYADPIKPHICRPCPCPQGASCSVSPGTLAVKCDTCPPGVSGPQCNTCAEGFFGDPKGEYGPRRECQRCRCGGPLNPTVLVTCDRVTGFCPKCMSHTTGFSCERCEEGFYRSEPTQTCKPCNCNSQGSLSKKCNDDGQCSCKEGSEGLRCERLSCPDCFNPVKSQVEAYRRRLKDMETLFSRIESGSVPMTDSQVENTLRKAETLLSDLQRSADKFSDKEVQLQKLITGISKKLFGEERNLQSVSDTVDGIKDQGKSFQKQISGIRGIIADISDKLTAAKQSLGLADVPLSDSDGSTHALSGLVKEATGLADKHQGLANEVKGISQTALREAEKALGLMRTAISGENKVTELINGLKTKFDRSSALAKALEDQGKRVSTSAGQESRVAADALKQITSLAKNLPNPFAEMSGVAGVLDSLKGRAQNSLTELEDLQTDVLTGQDEAKNLMAEGENAKQKQDLLLARVNAAKADVDESLKDINTNMAGLDEVLDKLRGFDEQIAANKALAAEASSRLPAINATIQQAVGKNAQTQNILDSVNGDYRQALDTYGKLVGALKGLEGVPDAFPPSQALLNGANTLADNLRGLKDQADATMGQLTAEKDDAERQNERAKEVLADATDAYKNAKNTKDAVGDTLKLMTNLMGLIDQPATVDETKLRDMEKSIADVRSTVTKQLKPKLQELEAKEARQKDLISRMDGDIDRILADISNLEEIYKTIPANECFNVLPKEIA
ncbi:hypothetical protein GJAV_G00112020 [Gymnothorax javanicus]|nr:hypothetical protein GJAV_G00112020 [Gymnothorax javanicus]